PTLRYTVTSPPPPATRTAPLSLHDALPIWVLANLAEAASTKDPKIRKRLLTFTFIGGGFAGGEAVAETEDMVRDALRYYPDLHASDIRFVLIDAAPFVFPELTEDQRAYVLNQLRERGVEVKLETFLSSAEDGVIKTSDGDEF